MVTRLCYKIFVLLLLIFSCKFIASEQQTPDDTMVDIVLSCSTTIPSSLMGRGNLQVKVLLGESTMNSPALVLSSPHGFILIDPADENKKIIVDTATIAISCRKGHLCINGRRLSRDDVIIKAVEGMACFENKTYDGLFYVTCCSKKALLINCLDLEDYIGSVLHVESWPGWPIEVNKVLAIAARTYVVAMINESIEKKRPFHVRNSVIHQAYSGIHNDKNIHAVIEQTRGIIMIHDNEPIIAMYHACCGGIIPERMRGVDFKKAPYLARKEPCKYCKTCKAYEWTAEFRKEELARFLKTYIPCITTLTSIAVHKKDAAGLVRQVVVKGRHGITVLSSKIISKLPRVKSFCYSIKFASASGKIIFKGRGFGNHTGLCQWGAREMVRDGWDYRKILKFFYPGITFVRLVHDRTSNE